MKAFLTTLLLLLTSSTLLAQDNKLDDTALTLKSSYKFTYYMFDVYQVELYLEVNSEASDALTDIPKRLQFRYFRDIPAETLIEKANESLEDIPSFSFDKFSAELNSLNDAYIDVKEGDRYTMNYTPGIGTDLILNGKKLVTVPGKDFAKFYFGIWLSKYSFSKDLYKTLTKS